MLQAPVVLLVANSFMTESSQLWTVRAARLVPLAVFIVLWWVDGRLGAGMAKRRGRPWWPVRAA
jgi:hypothetical protein